METTLHGNAARRASALAAVALIAASATAPARAWECANDGAPAIFVPSDGGYASGTACGAAASIYSEYGTALGYWALAVGESSTVLGNQAIAEANYSIAVGDHAIAEAVDSTAFGRSAYAGGTGSAALGYSASSTGDFSLAMGRSARADGFSGVALGYRATAYSDFSAALGPRATANQPHTMVLGAIGGLNGATENARVAIGTRVPQAPLHIARSSGNARLLVDNINQPSAEPRSMLELINNGPIGFNMENVNTGQRWRFAAQTTGFRISLAGSGGPELEVLDNGNAVLSGNLFTNSDVNAKQDIVPVDGVSVLEKLNALPIAEWSYKDAADSRHLGPMAQDFHAAFGLGPNDTSIAPMDLAGVSLAAVKALYVRSRHAEQENRNLAARNTRLEHRLTQLEAQLSRYLDRLNTATRAEQH